MYDIENQGASIDRNQYEDHGEPKDTDQPTRSWSGLSDATIAAKDCADFDAKLDNHGQERDTQVSGTGLNTPNHRHPTRPQQGQHDRQRKSHFVMRPRERRGSLREATTSKAPVRVSNTCITAA